MKKLIKWILLIILVLILFNSQIITQAIIFSFKICIFNLFPSLFPMLIISNLLSQYGFIELCAKTGKTWMKRLFNINPNGTYVLFMSMISGSPSNAKYINDLLEKQLISLEEANQLVLFTHFINPLFIINSIGNYYMNDKKIGYIILFSHFIGNFIIAKRRNKIINYKSKRDYHYITNTNFTQALTNSIINAFNTLLLVLGTVTTFLIFTTLLNNLLPINPLFNGILEITQGIKYISMSNFSKQIKTIIITFIISFGGFSIHMQVISILNNKKIRYLPYFKARLTHAVISSIISMILFELVY